MKPFKLINQVQKYPWGTKDYIPELLGMDKSDENWAELWMGDHPRGTSLAVLDSGDIPLNQIIMNNSEEILGKDTIRFGKHLPFLFKVLSAGKPLSLQAHPSKNQAEEGFKAENLKGVPIDAYNRNYRDSNHKPEIICALTPFTAMCGFRDVNEVLSNFVKLKSTVFRNKIQSRLNKSKADPLKEFFSNLMMLDKDSLGLLIDDALSWAGRENSIESELIQKFSKLYQRDPGILSPLLLNVYSLNPGEALYQGPGELHAYVEGTGIELMSNSDNVLRGGLTPKYVDVEELLKVLNFNHSEKNTISPVQNLPGIFEYMTPSDEFLLKYMKVENDKPVKMTNRNSLEILICIRGDTKLDYGNGSIKLCRGDSLFLPASLEKYTINGTGDIFSAGIPGIDK